MATNAVAYTPPKQSESITATVARLDERTFNLGQSMAKVEEGMKGQDAKLDMLVADLNNRKGADETKRTMRTAVFSLVTGTGFIGWLWEHFHK